MTATAELVGRLRGLLEHDCRVGGRCWVCGHGDHAPCVACPGNSSIAKAFTTIETLAAALAEAERGRDEARALVEQDELASEGMSQLVAAAEIERDRYKAALAEIAAFDDGVASGALALSGSYGMFDEPGSVAIARQALSRDGGGE